MKKLTCAILAIAACSAEITYADSFVVNQIQINGLKRVEKSTVLDYLPIKIGDSVTDANTSKIIGALYKTGFFQDIKLQRQGNVLVIDLTERPTIGNIKVTGNSSIPTDKLNEVLKQVGLSEGLVFDDAVLERIKQGLLNEYYGLGRYNAKIEVSIAQQQRNRVAVKIDISEGRIAKIRKIEIIGNEVFKSSILMKELTISAPGVFTFFNRKDQYSDEKLSSSLGALGKYYRDKGYIRFKVDSAQIQLTQDRNEVYVIIRINEGARYTFSGFKLIGKFPLPEEQLAKLITLKTGGTYSQQTVQNGYNKVAEALGNHGFAFANVSPQPEINDQTKQVFVTYYINPGNKVYVRKVDFSGNMKTADTVLRRVILQPEGSVISVNKVKESTRQLRLYPFISNADVQTLPVPGIDNQVDLNYKVIEGDAAQATAGVGFSTNSGMLFNLGFQQPNFMGSGNSVGFNFTGSKSAQIYSFNYNNPYYTESGIGRGYSVYYRRITPDNIGLANYTTTGVGGTLNYTIPFTENSNVQAGVGYDNTVLLLPDPSRTAKELTQFSSQYGSHFSTASLNLGWSYLTTDRARFPTKGIQQSISGSLAFPLGSNPLYFYKLGYNFKSYYPIYKGFIFTTHAGLGYGNGYASTDGLPFYQNYFAGGIGTPAAVRGYESNTLGPKDSQGNPLGGNVMLAGSLGMILPSLISPDTLRTSVFVDAGNVYNTKYDPLQDQPIEAGQYMGKSKATGPIRLSTGIELEWHSPIGPLIFSLATPLNKRDADRAEVFQFTISTGF
ncbi:MAG: bamA [Gammaproteobacteria bacterium]|jgi:outer membrane protein insertion porin family|nr:bamA [Gammaproteobacteria bacterium]